jgi:hypothetical protein
MHLVTPLHRYPGSCIPPVQHRARKEKGPGGIPGFAARSLNLSVRYLRSFSTNTDKTVSRITSSRIESVVMSILVGASFLWGSRQAGDKWRGNRLPPAWFLRTKALSKNKTALVYPLDRKLRFIRQDFLE